MEDPKPIIIDIKTDSSLLVSELLKTQAYIRALAKTLLSEEQLEMFDSHYAKEAHCLLKAFLEEHQDLLKK